MEKTIDIFLKSYRKDFWLLALALKTISKNVTGYANLILLIPENEKHDFDTRDMPERTLIHYVPEYGNGYMYQQLCKLKAYQYSDADYIMFSDSDVFFPNPLNVQDLIKDEKPEILFTDYKNVGDAQVWQKPTQDLIGEEIQWEYMRRFPLVYHRSTLENLNKWLPQLEVIVMGAHNFSEFNLIGAYANKFEKENYKFTNTEGWEYMQPVCQQVWSHSSKEPGVSETHLREFIRVLETIMKAFDIPVPQ